MVGERIILIISTLLLWPQLLGYGALIGSFKDDKYLSPFIMIASSANCLMARLLSSDERRQARRQGSCDCDSLE